MRLQQYLRAPVTGGWLRDSRCVPWIEILARCRTTASHRTGPATAVTIVGDEIVTELVALVVRGPKRAVDGENDSDTGLRMPVAIMPADCRR